MGSEQKWLTQEKAEEKPSQMIAIKMGICASAVSVMEKLQD